MNNPDNKKGYSEKRRAARLYRRFMLRVSIFGERPLRWSYVTIHNLSSAGALFTFERQVYEGMLLLFRIDFPDRVVECTGRVARIAGTREAKFHDVAATFEGVSAADSKYIENFLEEFINKNEA